MEESDVPSLSSSLTYRDDVLVDELTGARHALTLRARPFFRALQNGLNVRELYAYTEAFGLSTGNVQALLGFLNSIGGLEKRWSLQGRLRAWQKRLFYQLHGVRPETLRWRKPFHLPWLFAAVLRACMSVMVLSGGVLTVAICAGLTTAGGGASLVLYSLALFIGSICAHEGAHAWLLRCQGVQVGVLQYGLRVGIIHARQSSKLEIASALLGPTVGVLIGCGAGACCWLLGLQMYQFISLLVGAFHVAALLPWYGDGSTLWKKG